MRTRSREKESDGDGAGDESGERRRGVTRPRWGTAAPDFELRDQHGQLGRAVVVPRPPGRPAGVLPVRLQPGLHRASWAPCGTRGSDLERDDLAVLAVSCDPMFTLRAYAEAERLPFALLSDFWPHGEVSPAYGVFDELHGCAMRSSFLVDDEGTVRWSLHTPAGQGRDPAEYVAALDRLRTDDRV